MASSLSSIVRRVILAESARHRDVSRARIVSEDEIDEELVAFVDSDIDPDSEALSSHQNFSTLSMTRREDEEGGDPDAPTKSMEDQLAAKRRSLRTPAFREKAEMTYGKGRIDLPILLIEATHLINNPVVRRFMLANASPKDLMAHKKRGGRGSEHIVADEAANEAAVTLTNQASEESQRFLLSLATQEMVNAVDAYNEGRSALKGETVIDKRDVKNLAERGVVSIGEGGKLTLSDSWHAGVVTILLCNPSATFSPITKEAFSAVSFSMAHDRGEEKAPSFIRRDITSPWLAVHRVVDALRSEGAEDAGAANPIKNLSIVEFDSLNDALEAAVVPSRTSYALIRGNPSVPSGGLTVPKRDVIAISRGIPVGARGGFINEGDEARVFVPMWNSRLRDEAVERFKRTFRGLSQGAGPVSRSRDLILAALTACVIPTSPTVKLKSSSELFPDKQVSGAGYGSVANYLFTHAIQMGSARGYRKSGVGLLIADIVPESIIDSMYNRERGGLRINTDFLDNVPPMVGYVSARPELILLGIPDPIEVFSIPVAATMLGNERLGRAVFYTRSSSAFGSTGSAIGGEISAFLDRCADHLARTGAAGQAQSKQIKETKGTPEFQQALRELTDQLGSAAAKIVQAGTSLFYSVAEEKGDTIVVGAVKKTASISRNDRVRSEVYRLTSEFKRKVDEIANNMVTGESLPARASDQAPQQNVHLVGKVWVG